MSTYPPGCQSGSCEVHCGSWDCHKETSAVPSQDLTRWYSALRNLLEAVKERPELADSIESVVLQDAQVLVDNYKTPGR